MTVQQVQVTNPSNNPVTLTSLILSDTDTTGNPPTDITTVTLYENGVSITSVAFSGTTATFNLGTTVILGSGGSVTFEVTATISSGASGSDQFSVTGISGTNGQPTNTNVSSVQGALITILAPTPTSTATVISASTAVIVSPNPSDGTQPVSVTIPTALGSSDVKVQIFTTAFRKVQEQDYSSTTQGSVYPSIPASRKVAIKLVDNWNKPLASGLYYVVVHTSKGRSIGKLLLLR